MVLVTGLPGSGRSTLTAALRAAGIEAREAELDAAILAQTEPELGSAQISPQLTVEQFSGLQPTQQAMAPTEVVVVAASARDGISEQLANTWEVLAENYVPRILVWTFSDIGRADDDDMRAIAERVLGEPTTAVALPLADDSDEFAGVLDLRDWRIRDTAGERDADFEHREAAANLREELIDAVLTVTDDESALAQRISGMEPNASRLRNLVAQALSSGQFVPSMAIKATEPAVGIEVLCDVILSTQ